MSLTHLELAEQSQLDVSAIRAMQQKRGRDGAWGWSVPGGDETPVESVSLALYGARVGKQPRTSGERKVVIL